MFAAPRTRESVEFLYWLLDGTFQGYHIDLLTVPLTHLKLVTHVVEAVYGKYGDLDGDGVVGILDLLIVVSNWGSTNPYYDLDGSGAVDTADLLIVLTNWG